MSGTYDLNDFTEQGTYVFSHSCDITNLPFSNGPSVVLQVFTSDSDTRVTNNITIYQIIYHEGTIYKRDFRWIYMSSWSELWSDWYRISTHDTLAHKTKSKLTVTSNSTYQAPSTGIITGIVRKTSNTSGGSFGITSDLLGTEGTFYRFIHTIPGVTGAYIPVDFIIFKDEIIRFKTYTEIQSSDLYFVPFY